MAIQNISSIISSAPGVKSTMSPTSGEVIKTFGSFLKDAIEDVNKQQAVSSEATKRIAAGDVKDLHKALILKEQAGITLDLTIQVRNKVVEAYQEVMRMSV